MHCEEQDRGTSLQPYVYLQQQGGHCHCLYKSERGSYVWQKEPEVEGTSGWRDFLSFRLGIQQWMARQLDLVPGGDQQRWGSHLAGEPEGSS